MNDTRFDSDWRDDIYIPDVLDIPLVFPRDARRKPAKSVWVQSRFEREETSFDQEFRRGRVITYLLKRSDAIQYNELRDSKGNPVPKEDDTYDAIFRPQAWMTDALQERCMVYAAAQCARGKVLTGGLGLAIYPQFCFFLQRPVDTITVVEKEPDVIDLVMEALSPQISPEARSCLHVVGGTMEAFLQESLELFDTIYLDTWDNMDPRFLPWVNHLVRLALPRCAPHGQIQCWGYTRMVETFIEHTEAYVERKIDLSRFHLDPAMERFAAWFADHSDAPRETVRSISREIALTTAAPLESYSLSECLTPFSRSRLEMMMNRNLSLRNKA
ncbi:MAG: hypothetical protein HQM04_18360 [Magnetococcales bacterium]|nr:hypothetical protein [Magnetococcales bacterium]